jgi:hypothetical protein
VEQAASDLQENRRLQQELTERIAVLKQEEALLADILKLAEGHEGSAGAALLPEQARDEPVAPKAARAPARATSRRSASVKAGTKGKSQQPLLGDVLTGLLGNHEEPRLAKELREELLEKHPDRDPTPQVVRNTLENLVARGHVQRHKQGRSVMYSLVRPQQVND